LFIQLSLCSTDNAEAQKLIDELDAEFDRVFENKNSTKEKNTTISNACDESCQKAQAHSESKMCSKDSLNKRFHVFEKNMLNKSMTAKGFNKVNELPTHFQICVDGMWKLFPGSVGMDFTDVIDVRTHGKSRSAVLQNENSIYPSVEEAVRIKKIEGGEESCELLKNRAFYGNGPCCDQNKVIFGNAKERMIELMFKNLKLQCDLHLKGEFKGLINQDLIYYPEDGIQKMEISADFFLL